MTQYEALIEELASNGVEVIEFDFTGDDLHGLYADGCIAINQNHPFNGWFVLAL